MSETNAFRACHSGSCYTGALFAQSRTNARYIRLCMPCEAFDICILLSLAYRPARVSLHGISNMITVTMKRPLDNAE